MCDSALLGRTIATSAHLHTSVGGGNAALMDVFAEIIGTFVPVPVHAAAAADVEVAAAFPVRVVALVK